MNECLACEQKYTLLDSLTRGTPEKYSNTYCSPECTLAFEQYLETEKKKSAAFEEHCSEKLKQNPQFNLDNVQDIIESFKLKVKVD